MADQPWWGPTVLAAALAAIPASATGVWALLKLRIARREQVDDRDEAAEARERERQSVENVAQFGRLNAEIADLRAQQAASWQRERELAGRLREVERDRDRGWDLARAWSTRTHVIWHFFANQLQPLNLAFERAGLPSFVMPDKPPSLEDIKA